MVSRLNLRPVAFAILLGILFSYQNCSQPVDNSAANSDSSFTSTLPFAYVSKVDTIAYMSCSQIATAVEPRAYFSYRVGAYNNTKGGIALSTDFRNGTQYFDVNSRAEALNASTLNSNVLLNLSIRQRSNVQIMSYQGSITQGKDIDDFLPALDSPDIAGPLAGATAGHMINYFPGAGDQRLMEASLRFYQFENVSSETRSNLMGNATANGKPSYLVVGYSGSTDPLDPSLRVPGSPVSGTTLTPGNAYGTGFGLSFSLPYGYSIGESRVLSPNGGISEYDLTTGKQVPSAWDCSSSYQFMVIRPEDLAANLVTCTPGPDVATTAQQPALNAIRRVLRVEDWFVDMAHNCVIPKRTGDYCYGPLQAGQTIQYGSSTCTNQSASNNYATFCPHFVSVCIRQ